MKTIRIKSVRQLLEELKAATDPDLVMFRGQTRDWTLLPSIGRFAHVAQHFHNWRVFHEELVRRFLRLAHPHLAVHPMLDAESWVLAQHHGLPTRLLDTTTNPLKGLFFAVNHPAEDSHDGVLWVFSYTGWREDLSEEHRKYWDKLLVPFLPPQLNPRLTAQEGTFISYPLPSNRKPLKPVDRFKQDDLSFMKFVVPAAAKPGLRRELAVLGVQFRLLFPDLDGVARSVRLTELEI